MLHHKYYKELDIIGAENISAYLTSLNDKWGCGIEIKNISQYDYLIGEYQSFIGQLYFIVGNKITAFKNKFTGICYKNRPSIPTFPKDSIFYGLKVYDNCEEIDMTFYGIVDYTGRVTLPLEYETISFCSSACIYAYKESKCGVLDLEGNEIIPFKFDNLYRYAEGLIAAKLNKKIGFVDGTGKCIIPFVYDAQDDDEYYFCDGLACVARIHNDCICYGYINHNNEEIFNFDFDFLNHMVDGTCTNTTHESREFGYTNDRYLLMANGKKELIDSEFIDTSDDYVEQENKYYEYNDNDKMDAFEGDYDALWNID